MHNKLANMTISANQSFFPSPTPFPGAGLSPVSVPKGSDAGGFPASQCAVGMGMVDNDSITSRILTKEK